MATPKKTKTPTTTKNVSRPVSATKKSVAAPQKAKAENTAKVVETKTTALTEKTTHEQAYLSISIALTGVLYFILLFLTYIYFNYDIMLFPKA